MGALHIHQILNFYSLEVEERCLKVVLHTRAMEISTHLDVGTSEQIMHAQIMWARTPIGGNTSCWGMSKIGSNLLLFELHYLVPSLANQSATFQSLADSRSQKELQKHTHTPSTTHMKKPLPVRLCGLKKTYLVQRIKPSTLDSSLYYNLYSPLSNILITDSRQEEF